MSQKLGRGTSAQKLGGGVAPDFDSRFGGIEATGDSSAAVHGLLDNNWGITSTSCGV